MIKKTPIYELIIDEDDELSGVEKISLVKSPANKYQYRVFDEDEEPHDCTRHLDFSDEALKQFDDLGEELPVEVLLEGQQNPVDLSFQEFAAPNPTSSPKSLDEGYDDPTGNVVKRYVYIVDTGQGAPLIKTSRTMCRKLIRAQKVYRRNDLTELSRRLEGLGQESFKYVFRKRGLGVDVFQFKFGKNDRHCWRQLEFYKKPNETFDDFLKRIPNNSRRATSQADAVVQGGGGRPFISEARYLAASDDRLKPIGFHFGLFIYKDRYSCLMGEPEARKMTKIKVGDIEGWVGAEAMEEYFEGTAEVMDYFNVREMFVKVPEYIREVAKRVVDYTQENGWGSCGTQVGKTRANNLADPNYDASLDVLTRMYSYGSRHKKDWEASKDYEDGCGFKMMAAWGFSPSNYDQAMSWLERQMEQATEMSVQFSSDEYKGDITAVVFEPDQYIYRWDEMENKPYYVFMSRDTIRKMLMKVSRLKPKDFINLEHTDKVFDGNEVYTYENWLVGDNPREDKSYEIFGREMKPGSWITTIHFKNKDLFNEFILSNRTAGVSLEGLFQEVPFNFTEVKEDFVKPRSSETKDEFISRCMGDTQMIGEFPNEEQRAAVCYSYYENKFNFPEGTCWSGYEPYGTKIVDGREVPNCIPVETSQEFNEEIEVYGYTTRYFYMCPGAIGTFNKIMSMNNDPEIQGMIRSAALQADRVFELEAKAVEKGYTTQDKYNEMSVLVDDYEDLIREIAEEQNVSLYDVSYMDGHLEVMKSLLNPENENMEDVDDDEMITYLKELLKYYVDKEQ